MGCAVETSNPKRRRKACQRHARMANCPKRRSEQHIPERLNVVATSNSATRPETEAVAWGRTGEHPASRGSIACRGNKTYLPTDG